MGEMRDFEDDRRQAPYTNSKMHSPALIWAVLVTLISNIVVGVIFAIRLEGAVAQNANAIQTVDLKVDAEVLHIKELQSRENLHLKEALEDAKEDRDEIKRLIREALQGVRKNE